MRSLCAILGVLTLLVLTHCSSGDTLATPTPPDRYDHIEQQMLGVHPGIRMWDVRTLLGKPDYAAPFSYGFRKGPNGLQSFRVRCLIYVGYRTWQLCFDNSTDPATFRLASKRRV